MEEAVWYLSFADDDSGGFLGAVIIKARSFLEAVDKTHMLGINPGGEVVGGELRDGLEIAPRCMNVLLTKERLEQEFGGLVRIGEI